MRPEQFIREELRKEFGEEAARKFDEALAAGLPCELCGRKGGGAKPRKLDRPAGQLLTALYEAALEATPAEAKYRAGSFVSATDTVVLCDECGLRVEKSEPTPGAGCSCPDGDLTS